MVSTAVLYRCVLPVCFFFFFFYKKNLIYTYTYSEAFYNFAPCLAVTRVEEVSDVSLSFKDSDQILV